MFLGACFLGAFDVHHVCLTELSLASARCIHTFTPGTCFFLVHHTKLVHWTYATRTSQVFKGLKNDVQPVAIKVLNQTDTHQLAEFAKVNAVQSATKMPCTYSPSSADMLLPCLFVLVPVEQC